MLIVRLERIRPEKNERRFYALYFENTFFGPAVVRVHGRKGSWSRMLPPVFFSDLAAAMPYTRRLVRRRLQREYRITDAPALG